MGDDYKRLEAEYQAGKISRRTFLRRAAALGVFAPMLLTPQIVTGAPDSAPDASDRSAFPLDPAPPSGEIPIPQPPSTYTPLTVSSVSPIAGATAGGITVTVTGSGFQPNHAVYFGGTPSLNVTYVDSTTLRAQVPAATAIGSVTVSVVSISGGRAGLEGGFTYITINQSAGAQVLGIAPLAVIENTQTEVTIRGRNLIRAYNEGLVALRGPSRAQIAISNVTTSRDLATGIEALTMQVSITAQPALGPMERLAIQVLASCRAGARADLVVETSRQMLILLPRSTPVSLAYTANLDPDRPNLVVIAGRNLAGCTLEVGAGATIHLQHSDDKAVVGIVSVDGDVAYRLLPLQLRSAAGGKVGQYMLSVTQPRLSSAMTVDLVAVPGQQIVAPTENDSAVYSLRAGTRTDLAFDWFNVEITLVDFTIVVPILNEVHLVPFFDGGGPTLDTPILAQVGKLFPVRGTGLLFALRLDLLIRVRIVLIIGFRFNIWPFGLYNEFPDLYPGALGTVVTGIQTIITFSFRLGWLFALVRPDGRLQVITAINLTFGVDFSISPDNLHLSIDTVFTYAVRVIGMAPLNNLLPCGGHFQLADDGGQTVFRDSFGGFQSFYFARAAGECCLPWDFNLELVRFASGQAETVVQPRFSTEYCLTAAPSANLMQVLITSVPAPTGIPPRLVMNIADTALIKALAQPVDEQGNPTGPLQDVRDLGYGVEFFLKPPPGLPAPDVLDPVALRRGDAFAVLEGENTIRAAVTSVRVVDEGPIFDFWPGGVLGFEILRFLAAGEPPRIRAGGLPVLVNPGIVPLTVTLGIAYRGPDGKPVEIVPPELERNEPFEAQREYLLVAKVTASSNLTRSQKLRFTVKDVQIVLDPVPNPSSTGAPSNAPLVDLIAADDRGLVNSPKRFFTGNLVDANAAGEITVDQAQLQQQPIVVSALMIQPNHVETLDVQGLRLVPPGKAVGNRDVKVQIKVSVQGDGVASNDQMLTLPVRNEETFEEYMRVLRPVQAVLAAATESIRNFASFFYAELNQNGPTANFLDRQGQALWAAAWVTAQASGLVDDRPLYYARLHAIAALRAYHRRNNRSLTPQTIAQFEWPSRGLAADGRISIDDLPASARKAIVTGFDPFGAFGRVIRPGVELTGLVILPDQSNPSGLVAIALHRQTVGQATTAASIRTAIFPVRYADFDRFIVENAIRPNVHGIVLLVTASQNGDDPVYYDVERFAAKRRGGGVDNNKQTSTQPVFVPNLPAPQFVESTLPYERVITSRQTLRGPNSPNSPFVIDQSFKAEGATGQRGRPSRDLEAGKLQHEPQENDTAAFTKLPLTPIGNAVEGSGGDFLSNEIFYRTAIVRNSDRRSLASGHFHLPSIGGQPTTKAPDLLAGVREALGRFLQFSFLVGIDPIIFPRTPLNTNAVLARDVLNQTSIPITIASVETPAPFSARAAAPLPVTLNPGQSLSLTFTFTPTGVGSPQADALVRNSANEVVLMVRLSGEGIAVNAIDDAAFFVRQQYRDFLNRDPSTSELDRGVAPIASALQRGDLAEAQSQRILLSRSLWESAEFRSQSRTFGLNNSNPPPKYNSWDFVWLCYNIYLRRNPNDPPDNNLGGFNFWRGELDGCTSRAISAGGNGDQCYNNIINAFIVCPEYRARFGPP